MNLIGYDIRRKTPDIMGVDPYVDIQKLLGGRTQSFFFDVGANTGQTVSKLRNIAPSAEIHCFEPSIKAFQALKANTATDKAVTLNNIALGAVSETRQFFECGQHTDMSSFLMLPEGLKTSVVDVDMTSLDNYCKDNGIVSIDLLKMDVQGFELDVLSGADSMISNNGVKLILTEFMFRKIYKEAPGMTTLYDALEDKGYRLISFYRPHFRDYCASYLDALFIHSSYLEKVENRKHIDMSM